MTLQKLFIFSENPGIVLPYLRMNEKIAQLTGTEDGREDKALH